MHPRAMIGIERILLVLTTLVSVVPAAEAQAVPCGIRGTVFDQSGAPIPWAVVKAENRASGHDYATVASQAGEYWLRDLPSGSYLVTALSPGFRVLQVPAAASQPGATSVLPLRLSRAAAATTVAVISAAAASRTVGAQDPNQHGRAVYSLSANLAQSLLTGPSESQYTLCH